MRNAIALSFLGLIACNEGGLPGASADAAAAPDASAFDAGNACATISAEVNTWLAAHRTCASDLDCTFITGPCGLITCGTYTNAQPDTELDGLISSWSAHGCTGPCPSCPRHNPPACIAGLCEMAPEVMPQPIGAACRQDSDCQSGACRTSTQDPLFVGGACTQYGCSAMAPCPGGSVCTQLPSMNGAPELSLCLAACSPSQGCRAGYSCCGFQSGECIPNGEPIACAL